MRNALGVMFLAALAAITTPATAEACSCAPSGPPCQEVWESPLVFAGTVIELDQQAGTFSATRVRFRVEEAFRGTEGGEVDIHLRGSGGASCDPPFKIGETWLVYANNRWEGGSGWTTSTCSRTRVISAAADDLAFLRTPNSERPSSRIVGRVAREVYDPSGQAFPRTEGVADVSVIATTRNGTRLEARTGADGRYALNAPPGDYTVEFESREGVGVVGGGILHIANSKACAVADAHVPFRAGRVTGQVVDHRGLPVPFLPVTMASFPRRMSPARSMTDAAGRFAFDAHFPGPYRVIPGAEGWPSTAADAKTPLVMVASGAQLDAGRLRLPALLDLVLVEFIVEDGLGRPAPAAEFTFRHPDIYSAGSYEPSPRTDEKGRFLVTLAKGMTYEVTASYDRKTAQSSVYEEIITSIKAGPRVVRLRLGPSKRFRP